MKFAHIINPVKVSPTSDIYVAQPVTFESMKKAKMNAERDVEVELLAACYPEDRSIIPDFITELKDLTGSVLDLIQPEKKRKLPLIRDILDRLFNYSDADYFIYSNVDIALMPQFYNVIHKIIHQGFDAFVVNRRTISNTFTDVKDILFMYSDVGKPHPGFDCFIFKRDLYKNFFLGNACIGANWIGRVLITNLIANANKFEVFKDFHLTFHIGDNRSWSNADYYEYDRHNEIELRKTLRHFKSINYKLHPMLEDFLQQVENVNHKIPLYNEVSISQNPIFVVGFTRSGTTLLQSLIATQNNIYTFPETHFFCEYLNCYLKLQDGKITKESLNKFFGKSRSLFGLDIDWYEINYLRVIAEKGLLTEKTLFENIVKHHLVKQVDCKEIPNITWLEKTPYHGLVMDKIINIYPDARFISIIRHPLPAIYSTKKHIHPDESYEFIASKWKRMTSKIETFKNCYPDKIYSLTYEDLVKNTETIMKDICRFLKIDFNKDKLSLFPDIAKNTVKPFEKWKRSLFKDKIRSKDNKDFLSKMSLKDILRVQNLLKKEITHYGFKLYKSKAQEQYNKIIR